MKPTFDPQVVQERLRLMRELLADLPEALFKRSWHRGSHPRLQIVAAAIPEVADGFAEYVSAVARYLVDRAGAAE